jgi:hypothetical protein
MEKCVPWSLSWRDESEKADRPSKTERNIIRSEEEKKRTK